MAMIQAHIQIALLPVDKSTSVKFLNFILTEKIGNEKDETKLILEKYQLSLMDNLF